MPGHEVIGVVQDVRENGVYQPAPAIVYSAFDVCGGVRHGRAAERHPPSDLHRPQRAHWHGRFSESVRQAVWSVNASLPVSPRTMREVS